MDVRFMRLLFIGFVHAVILLETNAQSTHDSEGKACVTPDGEGGVCLQLPQCPRVVHAITRGIRQHTRCGFIDAIELVCCAREPLNADSTNPALHLLVSSLPPPTTPSTESSTRGSSLLFPYLERNAVPTLHPTTSSHVDTSSTTVISLESYDEDSKNEVQDVNLDTNRESVDGIGDRIFLGNNDRNKMSPTLFAFNTLTGFVNAILGKPPTIRLSATKRPPLLRPVTKPPMRVHTTPMYILHNERVFTRKPGHSYPPPMFPLPSTTHKPILDLQPDEILTYKPKPSQSPTRDQNPTTAWQNVYSTHSPGISNIRPEYPFIPKPFPLSGSATRKPFISVHVPLTEKPNTDETTVLNVLSQPTYSSEHTLVENVQTSSSPSSETSVSSTVWNEVLEISTPPVRPNLESATTEIPMPPDPESTQTEVLAIPNVPFVTPIPSEILDLGSVTSENRPPKNGELPTSEPSSEFDPSSEKPLVGRKSQEACARYREIPKLTRYIIGGDLAAHGEFPHMVALGFQRPRQTQLAWMCGGTLLNEEYVLTAAHCVVTRFGRPVSARVGYTNLTADGATGLELAVRDATVHPAYDAMARSHDVAVLRLATRVRYSQFAHPACLHAARSPPPRPLLVSGWGSITPDGLTPTDHLKRAPVTPVEDRSCRDIYPRIFRPEMICAIGIDTDTCKGDSGGPMQYLEEPTSSIYTVVGVTSFGPNPCATGRPGVYSRVASYLPWIEAIAWPN